MTAIEMFLRLGCSLVGWMVLYAYCLWMATLRVIGCGVDGDQFWRLLFGFAPVALGFAALIGLSARLPSIHQILRWGVVPLLVLVPLAVWPAWTTFDLVNLQGKGICAAAPSSSWQLWWAPAQFATLLLISAAAWRAWRQRP